MIDDRQFAVLAGRPTVDVAETAASPMLHLRLFQRLESDGIRYCVLPIAAAAQTVELLVDRRWATELERALAELGCKRLQTTGPAHGAAVVDWLGFQHAELPLLQLRAHYRLLLRPDSDDPTQQPWEQRVLAARRRDPVQGCYVAAPEHGAWLQAVRQRPRGHGPAAAPSFAPGNGWRHRLARSRQQLAGWWRGSRRPVLASGGLSVAFVGCDGSGKSTVTREVATWFGDVLRVDHVYLGSGRGSSSLLRWPLLLVHRLLERRRTPATSAAVSGASDRKGGGWRQRLRPVWGLVLAREKRQKLRDVWRARHSGALVFCDRYPQNEIMGFNDGPLLSAWGEHRSRWRRALSVWERRPYQWAQRHPPDLVVKLRVSKGMALRRKPDMTAAEVERRIAAIDTLRFGRAKVLEVDADAPLAQVLEHVKTGIWAEL